MKDYSILIVDDSNADRYILKRMLKSVGIEGMIFEEGDASTAFEFLSCYQESKTKYETDFPPMIIFLDVNMPCMSGLEFLDLFSELRQEQDLGAIIVMMFTSSEQECDREQAFAYEFVKDYLVKGKFSKEELKSKIETICPIQT